MIREDARPYADDEGEPLDGPAGLVSVVETHDDAPDECTIHPVDVPDHELMTTWMTAQDGSFVSLDDVR